MYTDLKSYQNSVIIHDFTVEFVNQYIDMSNRSNQSNPSHKSYTSNKTYTSYPTHQSYKTYSRQADQMLQAARSGKQNIAEATANSKQKPKSETMLLGVASASLKELLEDYKDYLRQHQLAIWSMSDPRALCVRNLYKSNQSDTTDTSDKSYTSDKTYASYQTYLASPEAAANAMLCLISQTTYLLDNQIRAVEKQQKESGIVSESREQKLRRIWREEKERMREFDEMGKKAADAAAEKMFSKT